MIVAAAFCPHPPVLVPEVAQGAAHELDELRAACRSAITRVAQPGRRVVAVGAGPGTRAYPAGARGTLAGFGVSAEFGLGGPGGGGAVELPLSLTVAAWLLQDALGRDHDPTGYAIGPDLDTVGWGIPAADPVALLVMGDGSARRSTAAPGYLDERAEAFDATVARALADGDSGALASLDGRLGAELLAAGVPAWRAAGGSLLADGPGRAWTADLLYEAAPYGVGYFVAAWT